MIKYMEHEINLADCNYKNGFVFIPVNNETAILPETDNIYSELIQQIKEDVEARPEPEPIKPEPYFDEMTYLQANIVEVVVDNYNAIAGGIK